MTSLIPDFFQPFACDGRPVPFKDPRAPRSLVTLAVCILMGSTACVSPDLPGDAPEVKMPRSQGVPRSDRVSLPGLGVASWVIEGDGSADFGRIATAGDIDSDGYDDVLVGEANRAFLYMGSVSGLSTSAAWTASKDDVVFAESLSAAGDVDGDGFDDIVLGVRDYEDGQVMEGAAFVYPGSASGLPRIPSWIGESDQERAYLGSAVSSGDVNGDGFADVLASAEGYDDILGYNNGAVFLFSGSATGFSSIPSDIVTPDSTTIWAGDFGNAMSVAGDVNGDGFDDVVVGAPWTWWKKYDDGQAWLFLGSATGIATPAAWIGQSDERGSGYASSVSAAGDVNSDGYGDVLVTGSYIGNNWPGQGKTYLYMGSSSGLPTDASWTVLTDQWEAFTYSASLAGDVNGDGYGDVILGAPYYENGQRIEGRVWVYAGSATGLSTTALWMGETDRAWECFGYTVSSAGDVNGDGFDDILVGGGGYQDETGYPVGRVYLFLGAPCGLLATWYADTDGDGYGNPSVAITDCTGPVGHVGNASDCDDSNPALNPDATEIPGDGIDQDCDGGDLVIDTGPTDTDTSETGKPPIDTAKGDTSKDVDSDSATPTDGKEPRKRCGCGVGTSGASWMMGWLAAVGWIRRRRRRSPAP